MLRSYVEAKEESEMGGSESKMIASQKERELIYGHLEAMAASLARALTDIWDSSAAGDEAQKEKERKISVILQHLTCHGALG